ncbi:RNA polymerase sigma factor [Planktothrix mougeotii]|uniref:Uncharacterized protein n=1 Tax=Planktothrix mougeotii LEGE 06226 TaxID=1828728 RepID=A0ABR9UG24_9CYAN|nr:hypothetical protein [Planktothrix mougeotii]MBE9145420.1 hypothetical protein [Planktothrix mougeotii LEGE 06226]
MLSNFRSNDKAVNPRLSNQANMRINSQKPTRKQKELLINPPLLLKALMGDDLSDCVCLNFWYIYILSQTRSFMDYEFDQQLKQLASKAKKIDDLKSRERQKIVSDLIGLIPKSEKFQTFQNKYISEHRDILHEALHNAFISLNKSLTNYEIRDELFISWFIQILNNKIKDEFRKIKREQEQLKKVQTEIISPPDDSMSPGQKIREIITVDPEIKLQKNVSIDYQDWRIQTHLNFFIFVFEVNSLIGYFFLRLSLIITIQKVLLLRLEGKSAREIALEFGVNTKNPHSTAYRWIDYLEKSEERKAELNQYIGRYLSDWEEIRQEYL